MLAVFRRCDQSRVIIASLPLGCSYLLLFVPLINNTEPFVIEIGYKYTSLDISKKILMEIKKYVYIYYRKYVLEILQRKYVVKKFSSAPTSFTDSQTVTHRVLASDSPLTGTRRSRCLDFLPLKLRGRKAELRLWWK